MPDWASKVFNIRVYRDTRIELLLLSTIKFTFRLLLIKRNARIA